MSALMWVVLAFLIIVSIIDWKVRKIPSIFLTGMLFAVAFISVSMHPQALFLGILGFIASYMLFEAGYFHGVADIKVMTLVSFMLLNTYNLLAFLMYVMLYGLIYKSIVKIRTKDNECAFLPVFLFSYITLALLGGLF